MFCICRCCVGSNTYNTDPYKTSPFTRRIRDPNVLPVVDLTKSEMELFTLQDFKDKKLDNIQKKTEKEKSTTLVVCIDHGMCAAFYLPKDSLHDEENENGQNESTEEMITKPVIPPTISSTRRYLSVKKSLDKTFPYGEIMKAKKTNPFSSTPEKAILLQLHVPPFPSHATITLILLKTLMNKRKLFEIFLSRHCCRTRSNLGFRGNLYVLFLISIP